MDGSGHAGERAPLPTAEAFLRGRVNGVGVAARSCFPTPERDSLGNCPKRQGGVPGCPTRLAAPTALASLCGAVTLQEWGPVGVTQRGCGKPTPLTGLLDPPLLSYDLLTTREDPELGTISGYTPAVLGPVTLRASVSPQAWGWQGCPHHSGCCELLGKSWVRCSTHSTSAGCSRCSREPRQCPLHMRGPRVCCSLPDSRSCQLNPPPPPPKPQAASSHAVGRAVYG